MVRLMWLICLLILHSANIFADVRDDLAPVDGEIQGSSKCARVNGCKTLQTQYCTGPSGSNQCFGCFLNGFPTSQRNIFRADFYTSVKNQDLMDRLKKCRGSDCPFPYANEMVKYMLLKDDRIARSAQGVFLRHFDIPSNALYPSVPFEELYSTKFCDKDCVIALKEVCFTATVITHVRNWCLNIVEWVEDKIPDLTGPPSFIAYIAAQATIDGGVNPKKGTNWPGLWPPMVREYWASTDERAALVAAAATSVLLAGNWWDDIGNKGLQDFGFAIQHSLFLAIYAGRLRISMQQIHEQGNNLPGTSATCSSEASSNEALNFGGFTGNVFAAICATFGEGTGAKKLRYRPEIHERNDEGCVERTTGMAFIMPGDWITPGYRYSKIGSQINPDGISFITTTMNTPLKLYSSGIAKIFASAVAENLQESEETACTGSSGGGNGSNLKGQLAAAGVQGVGGICNWVASW